ncbi:MAG: hypothetical protein M1816_005551 [Peltula sp. TS41687]|nr:MAG: hypothetical protein M1816_005551 [Peltula sp. TS41687]
MTPTLQSCEATCTKELAESIPPGDRPRIEELYRKQQMTDYTCSWKDLPDDTIANLFGDQRRQQVWNSVVESPNPAGRRPGATVGARISDLMQRMGHFLNGVDQRVKPWGSVPWSKPLAPAYVP